MGESCKHKATFRIEWRLPGMANIDNHFQLICHCQRTDATHGSPQSCCSFIIHFGWTACNVQYLSWDCQSKIYFPIRATLSMLSPIPLPRHLRIIWCWKRHGTGQAKFLRRRSLLSLHLSFPSGSSLDPTTSRKIQYPRSFLLQVARRCRREPSTPNPRQSDQSVFLQIIRPIWAICSGPHNLISSLNQFSVDSRTGVKRWIIYFHVSAAHICWLGKSKMLCWGHRHSSLCLIAKIAFQNCNVWARGKI